MARSETANARSRRTRSALLAAALTVLESEGPEAVTMAGVADLAQVSRRATYLHFTSRRDLINGLFDYVNEVEQLDDGIADVLAAPDAETGLRRYAALLAHRVPRILGVSNAIHQAAGTDPDAAAHWATAMEFRRRTAGALTDRLAAEGRLSPAWTRRTGTDMLLALVSNDVLTTLFDDCGWSADEVADRLATTFCAVLVTDDRAGTLDDRAGSTPNPLTRHFLPDTPGNSGRK